MNLRRLFALVLAGASLVVAASHPSRAQTGAEGRNLLANPGFEQALGEHPWMPAAWDTFEAGLSTVFFGRDTMLARSGRYSVNVANVSTLVPMWHNWSQTLVVDRELWGKDAVFSVWTRSAGLQGRAYVLINASRDTITKMARLWGVPRDTAMARLEYVPTSQPVAMTGWQRLYFSEPETDWVRREVRTHVPEGTNVLTVRGGVFGIGQVFFDDASLVAAAAAPPKPYPIGKNLLADASFEGDGNAWEYSMPAYEGMRIEVDSTVAHFGKRSARCSGGTSGPLQVRTGVCQLLDGRSLVGKRLRLTAWSKTTEFQGLAYLKIYCSTADGDAQAPPAGQFGGTTPWTRRTVEMDVPPGTNIVSAWCLYNGPVAGDIWYDDVSLEVLGPADYVRNGTAPPAVVPLSGSIR